MDSPIRDTPRDDLSIQKSNDEIHLVCLPFGVGNGKTLLNVLARCPMGLSPAAAAAAGSNQPNGRGNESLRGSGKNTWDGEVRIIHWIADVRQYQLRGLISYNQW